MSRIGKKPIDLPDGVEIDIKPGLIKVKGPKGELARTFSSEIGLAIEDGHVHVTRSSDVRQMRALHGTTRAVLSNMIHGVSEGFTKQLQIDGVGYRAEMKGKQLVMALGYSHPVAVDPPVGVAFAVDEKTRTITVSGIDKETVGQVAANLRAWRPPEPYKGKGVRYSDEVVVLKETKKK